MAAALYTPRGLLVFCLYSACILFVFCLYSACILRMKLSTVVQSGSEEGVFSESFHSSVMDLIRQMDHHGYSQAGVDMATQYIDTIKLVCLH